MSIGFNIPLGNLAPGVHYFTATINAEGQTTVCIDGERVT